jgi:hypothetical protein
MLFGLFGLTAFITEWYPWRWMMWILAFPHDFAALLVAIGLFVMLPRYVDVGRGIRPLTWLTAGIALAGVQLTWIPIETAYTNTASMWNNDVATGRYIASIFSQPEYRGGVLNLPPPDHPAVSMRSCTMVGSKAGTSSASCMTRSTTCRLATTTSIIQRRRGRSSNAGFPALTHPSS